MSDSSAAQEKLAVWLLMVVRNAAAVELPASFCTFWNLFLFFFFFFLIFDLKVGVTYIGYFVKLPAWLVVVVGIAAAME